ncbi:MAG TPA: hypothetical protein VLF89_08415 [Candidatus Saccharimonadales bacterium]|nr:hypothetical protein [Candidatus Saccharimonadales bacterium]
MLNKEAFTHTVINTTESNASYPLTLSAQRAIDSLQLIPEAKIQEIQHFQGNPEFGSVEKYIIMGDATEISQSQFLTSYARLTNRVAQDAKALIANYGNLENLRNFRESVRGQLYESVEPVSAPIDLTDQSHKTAVDIIDTIIKRRIVAYERGQGKPIIELGIAEMACNQAIMSLDCETRKVETAALVTAQQEKLQDHKNLMHQAKNNAEQAAFEGKFTHPISESVLDEWFLNILDLKYITTEKSPSVIFVNDIDSNMGETSEYDKLKPANSIDALLSVTLDKVHPIPGRQRVPIIHSLQSDPKFGSVISLLYQNAGRNISLFADVPTTVQAVQENGGRFIALTANMQDCGAGAISRIGIPIELVGQSYDSVLGPEKPTYLINLLAQNPNSVIVHSDDADARIVKALQNESVIDGMELPLALEDVVFFATRKRSSTEYPQTPFKLEAQLSKKGIPYAVNKREVTNQGIIGYQGTKRMAELYKWWKQEGLNRTDITE